MPRRVFSKVGKTSCPIPFPQHTAYSFYVPRTDNHQRKIDPKLLHEVANDIIGNFGGISVEKIQGCWINSDNNKRVCDKIIRMTGIRNYTRDDNITALPKPEACDVWKQDQRHTNRMSERMGALFGQGRLLVTSSPIEAVFRPGKWQEALDAELLQTKAPYQNPESQDLNLD